MRTDAIGQLDTGTVANNFMVRAKETKMFDDQQVDWPLQLSLTSYHTMTGL